MVFICKVLVLSYFLTLLLSPSKIKIAVKFSDIKDCCWVVRSRILHCCQNWPIWVTRRAAPARAVYISEYSGASGRLRRVETGILRGLFSCSNAAALLSDLPFSSLIFGKCSGQGLKIEYSELLSNFLKENERGGIVVFTLPN